jgi:hypothetical protein
VIKSVERVSKPNLEENNEENNMTPSEILWRNPYPVRARCRRRRFEREGENSLYVLQEFV